MTIVINGVNQAVPSREDYGASVQDITALKTIAPSDRFDQQQVFVEDEIRPYYFNIDTAAAESLPDIVEPDDAPASGRWIRLPSAGGAPAAHGSTHKGDGSDPEPVATPGVSGDMSAADKTKLDAIASGADVTGANTPQDHAARHAAATGPDALSTAAAGAIAIGDAAAAGAAETFSRADHKHSLAAPAAPADVTKAAAATGAATAPARADHKHDVSTAAAATIGTANAEGAATSLARSDHVHNHGAQTNGAHHAAAIASGASGFMTGGDKAKLDALGATHIASITIQEPDLAVRVDIPIVPIETEQFSSGITVVKVQFKTSVAGVYSVDFRHYDDVVDTTGTLISAIATAGGEDEKDSGAISVNVAVGRTLGVRLPATVIDVVQCTIFYKAQ